MALGRELSGPFAMKTWVVLVAPSRAEAVRQALRDQGLLRRDLRAVRTAAQVAFPVSRAPARKLPGTRLEEREIGPARSRPRSYRDLLELDPVVQKLLPRAFDVLGDVVLVRLPAELSSQAERIGDALLRFVPGARKVGWDQGVHGTARIRRIVPIAGAGPWRTLYRENGLEFVVDPEQVYFSPRLAREHARVASEAAEGETIWDLCCGLGPFSMAIAHRLHRSRIVAVDSNPAAIELLRENAKRQSVADRIDARVETVERFLTSAERADRVILNLPHEGIKYLPSVSAAVAPGGTVHYYEVTPHADASMRESEILDRLQPRGRWEVLDSHRVHAYAPHADLRAFTLRRR